MKLPHPDSPAMRAVGIAINYKTKCDWVLSKVGLLKPKLGVDDDTGKCRACGDMEGFLSGLQRSRQQLRRGVRHAIS